MLRVVVALFVLAAAASLILPRLSGFVAKAATVNAPIQTLRAPFEGRIVLPSPSRAAPVARGETLIVIEALRESAAEVSRLVAQQAATSGRLATLDLQIAAYQSLSEALGLRIDEEAAVAGRILAARLGELRAEKDGASARRARAAAQLDRSILLGERGAVASSTLEDLRLAVAEADAELRRYVAAIEALEIERRATTNRSAIPAFAGAARDTRQRLDEIALRLIDIEGRRGELAAEHAAQGDWLGRARAENERILAFRPEAATEGVIWSASPSGEATVASGEAVLELLDCNRRFVEVTLSQRYFERIPPGSRAEVRLVGSDETFSAPVIALRGSSRETGSSSPSAIERSRPEIGVSLFLALPPADVSDPSVAAAFCDVGRSAEVRIVRPMADRLADLRMAVTSAIARLSLTITGGAPTESPGPG